MLNIGFRVAPEKVHFAIHDVERNVILNVETLSVPKALIVPEKLKYVRNSVLDILFEYHICNAVIKLPEFNSKGTPNERRLQIEAVIQEAFASSELAKYAVVHISNLAPLLGEPRERIKQIRDTATEYEIDPDWSKRSTECREAILCAVGAKNV